MTRYHYGTSGETYYAKPQPIVESPWADDVVAGVENGNTGSFAFDLQGAQWAVYRQLGASPDPDDPIDGWFDTLDDVFVVDMRRDRGNAVMMVVWLNAVNVNGLLDNVTITIRNIDHQIVMQGTPDSTGDRFSLVAGGNVLSPNRSYWGEVSFEYQGQPITPKQVLL
jgi:hypothetical protein